MLRRKIWSVATFGVSMLLTGSVVADSMRCGSHTIQAGQRNGGGKYEVLKKCGEPTMRVGNTWVYEKGKRAHQVNFNDAGQILSIR